MKRNSLSSDEKVVENKTDTFFPSHDSSWASRANRAVIHVLIVETRGDFELRTV